MLSVKEKLLLLDEVASTARSSWQIHLVAHETFSDWPLEHHSHPAYLGYCNLKNLLSASLMTACYSLVETGKKSYSLHHAVSDPSLNISPKAQRHCEACFALRSKISKYRNNVVGHVNAKRTQSNWAQAAGILNRDIDDFLQHSRAAIEELSWINLGEEFVPGVTMPVRRHFREFCRILSESMDDEHSR